MSRLPPVSGLVQVLQQAGLRYVRLVTEWRLGEAVDLVLINPLHLEEHSTAVARAVRHMQRAGAKLVPGDWVLKALQDNALPALEGGEPAPAPPPRAAPAAAAFAAAPRPAGGRRGGSGRLRWIGEPVEPPAGLASMKGQFRSFYRGFEAGGGQVEVGDCVQVKVGNGEVQVVRVVALYEEATRSGGSQFMHATRFYNPQAMPGKVFDTAHTHERLTLSAISSHAEVVMAPPGQSIPAGGGGKGRSRGGDGPARYICRYFYDHVKQELRALSRTAPRSP
eukprot:jgi/Tetstr1/422546/TSEL_013354.t1